MLTGQCHCGSIRYTIPASVIRCAVCHCSDCQGHAGAPAVSWATVRQDQLSVRGTPKPYRSSENTSRHFCADCGTGLFYFNELVMPGLVDIQTATLHDVSALAPSYHTQWLERAAWWERLGSLPCHDRFPLEAETLDKP